MAQKLLNRTEISTALEQVSRKSVPKRVRGQPAAGRQKPPCFFDQALDIPCIQPMPANADE